MTGAEPPRHEGEPMISTVVDGWDALVERDTERAVVDDVLSNCEQGYGRVVLLYGPAGVGRSSLLRAATLDAQARGIAVLEATGSELERRYSFGLVRQLLESHIARLSAAQRRALLSRAGSAAEAALGIGAAAEVPPENANFEQIQALHRLISGLACAAPLLLAIDDLQWCDRPSLDLLCFLGHRATRLPVAIIASWRRGEPDVRAGRLQALAAKSGTVFLTLGGLSEAGVAAVVRRETGEEPAEETVRVIHTQTCGQPFLVNELAAGVRLRGLPVGSGGRAAIEAITPESVRRNVVARLGRHRDAVQRLAHAAAVLGEGPPAHAAALAGIDSGQARDAAAALARAGILRDDAVVGFAQPLLRSAVYDTLSLLERAELHRRAAIVLLGNGAPLSPVHEESVLAHLLRSEPTGDQRVGELLRKAGLRAYEQDSRPQAQRILARALGDLEDGARRCEVLARLAELEIDDADLGSAHLHATEALSLASAPAERAAAAVVCAQTIAATSGWAAAVEMLEGEAPLLLQSAPALALLQASAATLRGCAAAPQARTIASLERLLGDGEPEQAILAVWASEMTLSGRGSAARVAEACARALADTDRAPRTRLTSDPADYLAAQAAILADAPELVERYLARRAHRGPRANARGVPDAALRAQLAHWRGELAQAYTDARMALTSLDELAPTLFHRRIRSDLLVLLAILELERSRRAEAEAVIATLAQVEQGSGTALACLRIAVAQPVQALALASAVHGDGDGDGDGEPARITPGGLAWRPCAALAYHAAGDGARARMLAGAHLENARAWGAATFLGRALTVCGAVAAGVDRLEFLDEAVAVLEDTPARLDAARATIELGIALRRARRPREARERLAHGADIAHRCGADALAARARAELVSAGARPRRLAISGIASLTQSELRVAHLAARGMTNREVARELTVSPKTVSGQLTAVYRKLDVHDRGGLVVELARASGQAPPEPAS